MPSNPIGFDASVPLSHYVGGLKAANVVNQLWSLTPFGAQS